MGPWGESKSRCKSDDCAGGFKFLNVDPIALKLLYSVISSSFLLLLGGSSEIVAHMITLLSWATPISGVEHGATLLLLPLDPKRYPSNKQQVMAGNRVW